MSTSSDIFELPISIEPSDIDELGHVNNTVYLRWVQDAATAHWNALAPPDAREELVWIVLRHEIDYKHAAIPGDEPVARTWLGEAAGLSFERHTEIIRARDERLFARARTLWCPVDAVTGRPRRVKPEIRTLFSASQSDEITK